MSSAGDTDYFPTQDLGKTRGDVETIGAVELSLGAPFGPLPLMMKKVSPSLNVCLSLANFDELKKATEIRSQFNIEGYPAPYLNDVVRAFRVLNGKTTYLEIGTFDRGNLSYVSTLLSDDALLIGVNIQHDQAADDRLRSTLKPGQNYISIVGDSRLPETVSQVAEAVKSRGRKIDAAFIDGDHTAYGTMCDYVNYGSMVSRDGVILFHDVLWEGNETYKGASHAIREIDRFHPVYLIPGSGPCSRYMPPLFRDAIWGCVGALIPSERPQ